MAKQAPVGWVKKSYWGLVQGENFLGHFFLLFIRLYWGGLLVLTGIGKWANIHGVAEQFSSLHIPAPEFSAHLVAAVEFLGGLSLFFGFGSRFFALLLTIVFLVAYGTAHHEAFVNLFVNPSLFIKQDPFLYLYAALVVLCFGPGLFSVDYWLERRAFDKAL